MKYTILFIFVSIIFSCNQSQNNETITRDNNKKLYNLLFKNPKIKDNLIKLFAIDKSETSKVFKILISRRNSFIRITIYQIFSKTEIRLRGFLNGKIARNCIPCPHSKARKY